MRLPTYAAHPCETTVPGPFIRAIDFHWEYSKTHGTSTLSGSGQGTWNVSPEKGRFVGPMPPGLFQTKVDCCGSDMSGRGVGGLLMGTLDSCGTLTLEDTNEEGCSGSGPVTVFCERALVLLPWGGPLHGVRHLRLAFAGSTQFACFDPPIPVEVGWSHYNPDPDLQEDDDLSTNPEVTTSINIPVAELFLGEHEFEFADGGHDWSSTLTIRLGFTPWRTTP